MKDFLTILLTMAAIAAFLWIYLKLIVELDLWFEKKFASHCADAVHEEEKFRPCFMEMQMINCEVSCP